jgi:hypothetical protein
VTTIDNQQLELVDGGQFVCHGYWLGTSDGQFGVCFGRSTSD